MEMELFEKKFYEPWLQGGAIKQTLPITSWIEKEQMRPMFCFSKRLKDKIMVEEKWAHV